MNRLVCGVLTALARPVEFEPVAFDTEASAGGETVDQVADIAILELDHRTAGRADQVMTMTRSTVDVAVGAVWPMNSIEQTQSNQQIERAEDGGPSYSGMSLS